MPLKTCAIEGSWALDGQTPTVRKRAVNLNTIECMENAANYMEVWKRLVSARAPNLDWKY